MNTTVNSRFTGENKGKEQKERTKVGCGNNVDMSWVP